MEWEKFKEGDAAVEKAKIAASGASRVALSGDVYSIIGDMLKRIESLEESASALENGKIDTAQTKGKGEFEKAVEISKNKQVADCEMMTFIWNGALSTAQRHLRTCREGASIQDELEKLKEG